MNVYLIPCSDEERQALYQATHLLRALVALGIQAEQSRQLVDTLGQLADKWQTAERHQFSDSA